VDTYSLRINWSAPVVGTVQNVLHYQTDTIPAVNQRTIAEELIRSWNTQNLPTLLPLLANNMFLTSYSARRMNDTGGPTYSLIFESQGTGVAPMADSAIALDVALAPVTFPWQPGHIYVGGLSQGYLADNEWDPAFLQTAQLWLNELKKPLVLGGGAGVTMTQVIWSRKLKVARAINEWLLRPKPTALNKRLAPYP